MTTASLFDKAHKRLMRMMPSEIKKLVAHLEAETSDPWKVLRLTIRVSSLCLFVTMLMTHDLWFQQGRLYAPAPLVRGLETLPDALNVALYAISLGCCILLFFFPQARRAGLILTPIFIFFALQDQLRGQFFIFMYVFNLLVAGLLPRKFDDASLDSLRYMEIGVYFWAGTHKINVYFFDYIFPQFVSPILPYFPVARYLGFIVPLFELSIGLFLLFPASRWLGQLMALAMVTIVLLSLGPLGHNGPMVVWPANVYMCSLAIFLFLGNRRPLLKKTCFKKPLAAFAVFVYVLIPVAGISQLLGPQQSFKLFCCARYAALQFGAKEKLFFLPPQLEQEVTASRRLNASTVTLHFFRLASGPISPTDKPFLDAFRGFCPRLKKPDEARLYTGDIESQWSLKVDERVYKLCAPEPVLVSGTPPSGILEKASSLVFSR